jgi:hypothetical protein
LEQAYRLFNSRQIDELLGLMTEDVEWPNVAEQKVLHGKQTIRRYWLHQFAAINPQVTPTGFVPRDDDVVVVVDQEIRDLPSQAVLRRGTVYHRYSFTNDLVRRMVVFDDEDSALTSA